MSEATPVVQEDPEVNAWIDEQFGKVNFSQTPEDKQNDLLEQARQEGIPVETVPQPGAVVEAPPAPAEDSPEREELDNGAFIEVQKTDKGYKAVLDCGNGSGAETFYGRTKNELNRNIYKAKLNATRKIRELNMQLKLGPENPAPQPQPAAPEVRETAQAVSKSGLFSAQEREEFKLGMKADPLATLEKFNEMWFERKTGLRAETVAQKAVAGDNAGYELWVENQAKQFVASHPDYQICDENLVLLDRYLTKHKMEPSAQNLSKAFEDLASDGLLMLKPKPITALPAPTVSTVPAENSEERIVQKSPKRPSAAYGLTTREVTPVPSSAAQEPSGEELDELTDAELEAAIRRANQQVRSSRR